MCSVVYRFVVILLPNTNEFKQWKRSNYFGDFTILSFRKVSNISNEDFLKKKKSVYRENLYEKSKLTLYAKYEQTHNWRTKLANCRRIEYLLNVRLFTVCSYFFYNESFVFHNDIVDLFLFILIWNIIHTANDHTSNKFCFANQQLHMNVRSAIGNFRYFSL